MPSRDAQWIIGTIVAAVIALSVQLAGVRNDHAEIRTDIRGLRTDMRGLDDRLRAVEIAFARVDQRLLILEQVFLPALSPGNLPTVVDDGRETDGSEATDPGQQPGN